MIDTYEINNKVIRYRDRDIVLVVMLSGKAQGMYRSTGQNSAMPGRWLPFDGVTSPYGQEWFNKARYVREYHPQIPPHLQRFGTEEIKKLSDYMSTLAIPIGQVVDSRWQVNQYLRGQMIR